MSRDVEVPVGMPESHYPECDLFDPICTGNIGGHIPRWMVGHACVACKKPCICPALRACEQRVRESMEAEVQRFGSIRYRTGVTDGKAVLESEAAAWATENYERGLDAAREAVAALPIITIGLCDKDEALAAIDALKEDK